MSDVLTQTEFSTYLRCRRKWWLQFHRRLRRRREDGAVALHVGSLVHSGLEAYYRPGDRRDPLDVVRGRVEETLLAHPEAEQEVVEAAELAGVMLQGYLDWTAGEGVDADLEVVGAERAVEVPLAEFRLRGKIDAVAVRRSDGKLLQLEHKTVGNLTDLPKVAQTNFQFLTYDLLAFLAARNLEPGVQRTDGVVLNMLRKVKRSKTARPPFYGRHEVRHNVEELRNHWRHVLAIAREKARTAERLDAGEPHHRVVPPTPMRDCSYACQFYAVCGAGMFDDGSDAEGMLAAAYEEHDPLARYAEDEPDA